MLQKTTQSAETNYSLFKLYYSTELHIVDNNKYNTELSSNENKVLYKKHIIKKGYIISVVLVISVIAGGTYVIVFCFQ